MISTRSVGLLIDTVVCLTLAKWETVSGRFGGYLNGRLTATVIDSAAFAEGTGKTGGQLRPIAQ